jgi:hypothetical protein
MSNVFLNVLRFELSFGFKVLLNIAANVEALAMWRYSVLRLPGAAAD